jgi:hypothetical protein
MNRLAQTLLRKTRSRVTARAEQTGQPSSLQLPQTPASCLHAPPPTCPGCHSNTKLNLAGAATSLISTFIVKRGISAGSTALSLGLRRWDGDIHDIHDVFLVFARPTSSFDVELPRHWPLEHEAKASSIHAACPSLPFSCLPTTRLSRIFVDWEAGVAHRPASCLFAPWAAPRRILIR